MRFGEDLMRQADVLGLFTEDAPRITRTYLSEQHKQAGEYLIGLMRRAGMSAGFDALGNVVGRYEAADARAPTVMTGSHMDSVRNAGASSTGAAAMLSPTSSRTLNRVRCC